MALNLSAFQEPRGVMRVLQFVFAICAFATTSGYSNTLTVLFCGKQLNEEFTYDYPFRLALISKELACQGDNTTGAVAATAKFSLFGDFSSDSQFFVATGVLSFLYCIGICVIYAMYDNLYQSNPHVPMADFILTVLLAVFWLSGSAAWSNGIAGLKSVTDPLMLLSTEACKILQCDHVYSGSFSTLNVSAILGFLNFFLWASDLWFLYKETPWFKNANPAAPSSPGAVA